MTAEEELSHLRQENRLLREQASLQQELIIRQQEQITLLERELSMQQEQLTQFAKQVKALQERLAKDSHNSHLPPSSDRFSRQPKSLRKKSGKQPGGQEGHPGKTLMFSPCPDEVIVHPVERCEQCQGCSHRRWWIIQSASANPHWAGFFVSGQSRQAFSSPSKGHSSASASSFTLLPVT